MIKNKLWLMILLVIFLFIFVFFAYNSSTRISGNVPEEDTDYSSVIACPEDVKLCADGSAVIRNLGNNCEFHLCPEDIKATCSELNEEECKNSEACTPVYLYQGCKEGNCDNPPVFNDCAVK